VEMKEIETISPCGGMNRSTRQSLYTSVQKHIFVATVTRGKSLSGEISQPSSRALRSELTLIKLSDVYRVLSTVCLVCYSLRNALGTDVSSRAVKW